MAIPSIPQNMYVQQGNSQVFISWDIAVGATSYSIQRSLDGVTFTNLTSPLVNNYLDTTVTDGVQYWYQVASVNASGTSSYNNPQSIVPTPTGEMSLGQIRLNAQQRADRVNSQFVTVPEWNSYINQSMYELYDLLITVYEDYYVTTPAQFMSTGGAYLYPLPNGHTQFTDPSGSLYTAKPFYKLLGVDLGINAPSNGWVTLKKFNFIDRNKFVWPNSGGTLYGVYDLEYRVMGSNIEFIPIPSAYQPIRIWYIPRLTQLLKDTDITDVSISGWIEYVIVDAAIKALQKEESDVSVLMAQKMMLRSRIESSAANRDVGQPDTISDTRGSSWWGDRNSGGWSGAGF